MEIFYYCGKPIGDIGKFCTEHNMKMVKYKAYRKVCNPFGETMTIE